MENLRKIFTDICNGYTKKIFNEKDIYIKHLSHFDQINIDEHYSTYYDLAKKRGLFTLKEKLIFLEKENLWTKKDQINLDDTKLYLDNLKKTKDQLIFKSQTHQIEKSIIETDKKYTELCSKKDNLIGLVCENYSDKKIELFYISILFFKDNNLTQLLFSERELNDIDYDCSDSILKIYYNFLSEFSHNNIKKISISDFFTSILYLSDNIDSFFGKPLSKLTFYQINLLSYGLYYKNIFKNNTIPDNIKEEPEKIEEFVKKTENIKQLIEKSGKNQRVGIIGATKDELGSIGEGEIPDILKYSNKKGGIDSIFNESNLNNF